jgi:hypothetical protein
MRSSRIRVFFLIAMLVMMSAVLNARNAEAQRPKPEVVGTFDDDTMYQVLPAGAIPAINDPTFVSGEEAAKQMSQDEPVIGLVIDGEARAYSLWHLDAHEIVNDVIGSAAVAVTW